jgi:hypothetical protein
MAVKVMGANGGEICWQKDSMLGIEGCDSRRFRDRKLVETVLHSAFPDIVISKYGSVYDWLRAFS